MLGAMCMQSHLSAWHTKLPSNQLSKLATYMPCWKSDCDDANQYQDIVRQWQRTLCWNRNRTALTELPHLSKKPSNHTL